MLNLSTPLDNALASSYIVAKPKILVNFDYNRIVDNISISNDGVLASGYTGEYAELWNLENLLVQSLTEKKGVHRATINCGKVYSKDTATPRSRILSTGDSYINWRNPLPASAAGVVSDYDVVINYNETVSINHISILFETSVTTPDSVEIQIYNGSWSSLGSFSPDADGWVKIYRQASSWSTTLETAYSVSASRVRFIVAGVSLNSPSDANAGDDVFVLTHYAAASLLTDMSSRVISFDADQTLNAQSDTSRNSGLFTDSLSIEIENTDEYFDENNASSPYYGMMKPRLPVTLYLSYDTSDHGGSGFEDVPIGEFFTQSWNESPTESTVSIECMDKLGLLQETVPPVFMCENYRISEIVKEIMYRVGATDVSTFFYAENNVRLPYFWTDGELGVFEILNEFLRTVPASLYTDYAGRFRFVDVNTLQETLKSYDLSESVDLISLTAQYELVNNDILVTYRDYEEAIGDGVNTNGREIVWQPDDIHLQAWKLRSSLTSGASVIKLDVQDNIEFYNQLLDVNKDLRTSGVNIAATAQSIYELIPESGFVNIQGERISWDGKSISGNNINLTIDERAYLNTAEVDHNIDNTKSTGKSPYPETTDMKFRWVTFDNPQRRIATKNGSRYFNNSIGGGTKAQLYNCYSFQRITNPDSSAIILDKDYMSYGMKFKFSSASMVHNIVGLAIKESLTDDKGLYVEIFKNVDRHYGDAAHGELRPYVVTGSDARDGGTHRGYPLDQPQGLKVNINNEGWNYLDVSIDVPNVTASVYLNGALISEFVLTNHSNLFSTLTTSLEPFVYARGHTDAYVDYTYVASSSKLFSTNAYNDLYNQRTGTYVSGRWVEIEKNSRRFDDATFVFKEWVPTVREGREFEGKYQKFPIKTPVVYLSNNYEAEVTRGYLTSFDFKIAVENITDSGNDAFLNSVDLTYRSEAPADEEDLKTFEQSFFIAGRPVVSSPDLEYSFKDQNSIRRNGRRYLEIDLPWVQGIDHAKRIVNNINGDWTEPKQVVGAEWFFHPGLLVSDVVGINYPSRNMNTTDNQYYIIGKSVSYSDGGVTSNLTLLRK